MKILFVCHGNICRSPMAESVCAYEIKRRGYTGISVASAAARTDEIGNPPHVGTREILKRKGIPLVPHRARLVTKADGEEYDYIIGMDSYNLLDLKRILGKCRATVCLLLDFSAHPRAIADPWYTGDFETTFSDVKEGIDCLLNALEREGLLFRR